MCPQHYSKQSFVPSYQKAWLRWRANRVVKLTTLDIHVIICSPVLVKSFRLKRSQLKQSFATEPSFEDKLIDPI